MQQNATSDNSLILNIELIEHGITDDVAMHSHGFAQLAFVTQGFLAIASYTGVWLAPPGQAVYLAQGVPHRARYGHASQLIRVLFNPQALPSPALTSGVLVVSNLLRELALEALKLQKLNYADDIAQSIATLMLQQISSPPTNPAPLLLPMGRDKRLQVVIAYMQNNLSESYSIEDLARIAHTSSRTLNRLFMNETGMNFIRWREQLRLIYGVEMLLAGASVMQTSIELGYRSPTSFTTLFTRLLGVPPIRYMQRHKACVPKHHHALAHSTV
jgi:AraC-like DNA-binding protein